jgi:hypothetical protein
MVRPTSFARHSVKIKLMVLALTAGTLALSALPAQANGRDDTGLRRQDQAPAQARDHRDNDDRDGRGWRDRDRAPARVVFVEPRHQPHRREAVVCRPRFFWSGPFVIQASWFSFGSREKVCYVTDRR